MSLAARRLFGSTTSHTQNNDEDEIDYSEYESDDIWTFDPDQLGITPMIKMPNNFSRDTSGIPNTTCPVVEPELELECQGNEKHNGQHFHEEAGIEIRWSVVNRYIIAGANKEGN